MGGGLPFTVLPSTRRGLIAFVATIRRVLFRIVDGDVQQKLDQIRIEIGRTPESALRRRIHLLLESGLSS